MNGKVRELAVLQFLNLDGQLLLWRLRSVGVLIERLRHKYHAAIER